MFRLYEGHCWNWDMVYGFYFKRDGSILVYLLSRDRETLVCVITVHLLSLGLDSTQ